MAHRKREWLDLACGLVILAAVASFVQSAAAQGNSPTGDAVVFTDNERLVGRILNVDDAFIEFDSSALGKLSIPRDRVSKLERSGSNLPLLKESPESRLPAVRGKALFLAPDEQQSALANAAAKSLVERNVSQGGSATTAPTTQFAHKTSVTVGISTTDSYVYGTQSQVNLGGDVLLTNNQTAHVCDPPSWAGSLHLSGSHVRSWKAKSTANTTNVYDGTLLEENAFSKKGPAAYYGIADLASNNSLGIGLQQSYGAGLSTIVYTTECKTSAPPGYRLYVSVYGDVRYMHERLYAPAKPLNLAGIRMGEDINYIVLGKDKKPKFSISETLWVIPTVNDIHAIQGFGALRFKVPITSSLSIGLTEEDDFLNNAPAGKRKNYSKSSVNLSYTFPTPSAK